MSNNNRINPQIVTTNLPTPPLPPVFSPLSNSEPSNLDLFNVIQLNCHNSFAVTVSVLNSETNAAILCLQEPWISPHTMTLPYHQNWSNFLDHNHTPTSYHNRHRACILNNKKYPSNRIHPLPNGSRILSAIDIDLKINTIEKIRIINLYNPPKDFEGIPELQTWMTAFNNWKIPTFLFMDSNLHHKLWNPPRYPHSHQQSKSLMKSCGQKGFKIISEKSVPTFVNSRSSQTTIDLTWANVAGTKFLKSCLTSSSNHQAISLTLNFDSNIQIDERLTCNLEKIDVERYQINLRHQIQKLNHINPTTTDDIDLLIQKVTIEIQNSVDKQKKLVNHNKEKIKPWWDGAILDPIVNKRNQARKWMLLAKLPAAFECYHYWQIQFKEKVVALKKGSLEKVPSGMQ
jgi:hypothetical protein